MNNKEKNIGDVLNKMMDKYRLTSKMHEMELVKTWEEITGTLVAKHTTKLEMRGKTLYAWFDQGPLKNEIFLRRDQLLKAINERLGDNFIEKIFIG
jgi:predicted nucleic acid-binding Zn ribbon protein